MHDTASYILTLFRPGLMCKLHASSTDDFVMLAVCDLCVNNHLQLQKNAFLHAYDRAARRGESAP